MKKTTLALVLALALLTGCGKEEDSAPTTAATTTAPPVTTTAPADPVPEEITVEHDHRGLHIKLDSSFTVGLAEDDENTFTFENEQISGSVTFGALEALSGGAATSKEYAETLKEQYGAENARIGTSTNVAFYVIHEDDTGITVESLYIHGQKGWLVTVESANGELTNQMVKIVGLCGMNADEIPV